MTESCRLEGNIVTPNEIAKALGVTDLQLRTWLRAKKAVGHPLLAGHRYRGRWEFSPTEAAQPMTEYRTSVRQPRRDRPDGNGALAACPTVSKPARLSGAPTAAPRAHEHTALLRLSEDPGHRVTRTWMGEEVLTLAELLRPGLRGAVVGTNPSLVSVGAGHYYQGRNGQRFFGALTHAGVLPPGLGFEDDRAYAAGLGFTDVVHRPTPRETGLRPGELDHGRELLEARLAELAVPKVIFTYKTAAKALLGPFPGFGLLPGRPIAGAEVFVMCGPMAPRADRGRAIGQLRQWWAGEAR